MAAALTTSVQSLRGSTFGSRAAAAPQRAALRAPLAVRAEVYVKPPQGVTLPPRKPTMRASTFGFVSNAEVLNSRAAMIGFFAILLVELVAGQGLLDMLGFATGNGLGFEF